MKNDVPIKAWRTRVRRLFRRGDSPEEIAAKLNCSADLVRLQLWVWGLLEHEDDGREN